MKLSKHQETEIIQAYKVYFDSYVNGDVKTIVSLLDDDYNQIGSAETEVFFNKEDAIKFLHDTIDQVAGKTEMRNRIIIVDPLEDLILVTDQFDIYALMDSQWSFYAKLRASTLMQKKEDGWKFIHQHSSMPDTRTEEGDNIAIEKVNAENLQLREAVKRRTVELEQKNKELKIEFSLERIRTVAMSMQKAEGLLEVVEILYIELKTLGFTDIRNTIINIFNDANEYFLNYDFSDYGVGGINKVDYNSHPSNIELVNKMREASNEFMITEFTGNELDEWRKWRIDQGQMPDSKLDQAEILYYYEYSIGVGTIGISTFSPINADQLKILNKIRNVFDLAYQRYADIEQAEAHAREAKIEAALERVRSRSLAMHKSEQLPETAKVLFEQFELLGEVPDRIGIVIINKDSKEGEIWVTDQIGKQLNHSFKVSLKEVTTFAKLYKAWKQGKDSFVIDLSGQDLIDWLKYTIDDVKLPVDETQIKSRRVQQAAFFSQGMILLTSNEPVADEIVKLLVRFAKVFDQAYTRFLDLQKAEAQAREAQIEMALERVRSKTMSMHKSDELAETATHLFEQLNNLGIRPYRCSIAIVDSKSNSCQLWSTTNEGKVISTGAHIPFTENVVFKKMYQGWKNQTDCLVIKLVGKKRLQWTKYITEYVSFTEYQQENIDKNRLLNEPAIFSNFSFKQGFFTIHTTEGITDVDEKIIQRFVKVFEQTYTRFLDLKKVEEQAREAQIEASLERIRSRALGMHKSTEVGDVNDLLFEEFNKMGIDISSCGISVIDEISDQCEQWRARQVAVVNSFETFSYKSSVTFLQQYLPNWFPKFQKAKKKGDGHIRKYFEGEERNAYLNAVASIFGYSKKQKTEILSKYPESFETNFIFFKRGWLNLATMKPLTMDEVNLCRRFIEVFDFAHTRFMDLKKAEAQVREAQIEAALERVRSKTMAMHNSEDMGNTVLTLFHEVLKLGLDDDIRCGIGILEETERMETRSATLDSNGEVDLRMGMLDMTIHPMLKRIKKAWKSGGSHFIDQMSGQDVIRYYTALNNEPDYPFFVDLDTLPETQFHNSFSFSEGILFAFSPNLMSEEATRVLDRFARVFGQTYRRFRDLQKAEEQTREAKIEASLERIRSQAMAMQHSDDLVKSTAILFEEFEKLELSVDRCGIGIFDPETRDCQLYTTVTTHDGKTELATGITSLTVHPMLVETFKAWESQQSLQYILEGKELEDYYALVSKSEFHLPSEAIENSASLPKEYYLYTPFGAGGLYVFSATEPAKEEKNIIRRFAEVFHLTYTRYEDLQKAEARALEAVKQASLDRVRGEIASMRTPEDLQRITPLIWSELEILDVPFIRCGVFIIDESNSNIQVHLTTPDGKPIGALNLPIDANELANNAVKHWRKNKVYTIHWNKEDFMNWMQSMISLGQVQTAEQYQGYSKPPESLDLHFIPFKQGMLYVGNIELLLPEKIELVNTLAKAFSVAYSRYEDFVNLEDAKTRVEKTLSELKSAQSQLIHSEKMASLGELTAGIAHEIQNPLNFVNNFSEVSVDLIEEMDEEMAEGNNDEVTAIAEDLKQNLEKITAHGKRASFIVKGMLEHSRTNTGEKKPTDINVLADEFLRLSYHGLRAKDKSFNAEFINEFDDNLPKINVISQDFGRVLLNLFNNAFYACAERSRSVVSEASAKEDQIYKPTVTVITKKLDDKVEIRVKDNGNGIPENIKDKIFQPFFTTKPTGEGTGLGLSLSYDIITKGHGGELKVKTKENEGTEFTILLPINQ